MLGDEAGNYCPVHGRHKSVGHAASGSAVVNSPVDNGAVMSKNYPIAFNSKEMGT